MAVYVQMKDDIAFAYVNSENFIDNSIILEDGINPDSVLAHKLINGEWVKAPLIYFVKELSPDGVVQRIDSTVYSSDVDGEIVPDYISVGWKKENGEWINFVEIQNNQQKQAQQEEMQNTINAILNSRPYPSWNWINNEWVPPSPKPEINPEDYYWDEPTLSWQSYVDSEDAINEIDN